MIVEPMLIAGFNINVFAKIGGLAEIGRVLLEQELPSQVEGFTYDRPHVKTPFNYVILCVRNLT